MTLTNVSITSFDKIVFARSSLNVPGQWILLAHVHENASNIIAAIFTSQDGATWKRVAKSDLPFSNEIYEFNDVAWDGDQWVVVGASSK